MMKTEGVAAALAAAAIISMSASASVKNDVEYLIEQMKSSDCTFVRNGTEYDNLQAAEHLQNKWEYAEDRVASTEMFINEVASKSWFTGRAYQVKCDENPNQPTMANRAVSGKRKVRLTPVSTEKIRKISRNHTAENPDNHCDSNNHQKGNDGNKNRADKKAD